MRMLLLWVFSFFFWFLSSPDVGEQLAWHPSKRELLLSGGVDGLVNVYDTRIEEEEEALLRVVNHGASVAHLGVLGEGEWVAVVSHDERGAVYRVDGEEEGGEGEVGWGDLRERLGCEYVVDVVPVDDGAMIAVGTHRWVVLTGWKGVEDC